MGLRGDDVLYLPLYASLTDTVSHPSFFTKTPLGRCPIPVLEVGEQRFKQDNWLDRVVSFISRNTVGFS